VAAIDWGPVSTWAGASATFLAALVALLVAMGVFDTVRAPRLRLTFEHREPWCKRTKLADGRSAFWVRLGVENLDREPAHGCVGRLHSVTTDGVLRSDIDPIQLRWAGVPRSRAFVPMEIRHGQREFLDVLVLEEGARWRILTFEDPDFVPGFSTELLPDQEQILKISVYSDNGETTTRELVACARGREEPALRLKD
jgi:hypothetical protein